MNIARFDLEFWLNPLDSVAKYNFGSSCCKPVTVSEMLELTGTDREEFFKEIENMSLHYGWFEGMPRMKKAIADLYTDVVTPEMVLSVHGGTGANSIVCQALCGPGEKVLILTPSYAYFKHAADYNGRELVCSSLIRREDGSYTMDLEDLQRKAADPKTTLCIFCNPHNPTGRVWTREELEAFGRICEQNGLWVISDEIHCDLLRRGRRHTPLGKVLPDYERLITCMAPSKTFNLAGMMFSNVLIRSGQLLETWKSRHYDFENPLSIAAAQAAYTCGEEWLEQLTDYLDGNFAFMDTYFRRHLPKARFCISEATYLAWVDVSAYLPEDAGFLPLYFANGAGVLLEGGDMFVADSDGYIRLNLACPRRVLETGLERICRLLNSER